MYTVYVKDGAESKTLSETAVETKEEGLALLRALVSDPTYTEQHFASVVRDDNATREYFLYFWRDDEGKDRYEIEKNESYGYSVLEEGTRTCVRYYDVA